MEANSPPDLASIGNALVDVIQSHTGDRSEKNTMRLLDLNQPELLEEFRRVVSSEANLRNHLSSSKYSIQLKEMLIRGYHKNLQ